MLERPNFSIVANPENLEKFLSNLVDRVNEIEKRLIILENFKSATCKVDKSAADKKKKNKETEQ